MYGDHSMLSFSGFLLGSRVKGLGLLLQGFYSPRGLGFRV